MTTETKFKSIYGCVLTNVAPASNYRGETVGSRNVLQKLVWNKELHTIVSAEAIRSRLREMLRDDVPDKINRSRIINPNTQLERKEQKDTDKEEKAQLMVKMEDLPDRNKFADDLLFGFLMIDSNKEKQKRMKDEKREKQGDSMFHVNYAVSLDPFPHHHNKTMHQSPKIIGAYSNAADSAIVEREVHVTAFQYPFGINLNDLRFLPGWKAKDEQDKQEAEAKQEAEKEKKKWVALLLRAIGELNSVGGGHARTMYPFAPVSIVLRLTYRRAPEFDLYGFKQGVDESQKELIDSLNRGLLPADEFYIGGKIVRENEILQKVFAAKNGNNETDAVNDFGKLSEWHLFETSDAAIEAVIKDAQLDVKDEVKSDESQNGERS